MNKLEVLRIIMAYHGYVEEDASFQNFDYVIFTHPANYGRNRLHVSYRNGEVKVECITLGGVYNVQDTVEMIEQMKEIEDIFKKLAMFDLIESSVE